MGKDADGCCETCKLFGGDNATPLDLPEAPILRARHDELKILVHGHGGTTTEVLPDKSLVLVGRATTSDVVLHSGTISRKQCTIEISHEGVIVRDNHSSCGTFIDGRSVGDGARLNEGSSIFVGDFRLQVVRR